MLPINALLFVVAEPLYLDSLFAMFMRDMQPKSHAAQRISPLAHRFTRKSLAAMLWSCDAALMQILWESDFVWPILALVGVCFGSFISLISYRMAHDLPWMAVRSRCPNCQNALTPRDLMPVVSYLLSGRKCRHCKAPMSARYVLIELATAASFCALFAYAGPTPEFLILAGLAVCIITMMVTDLEHYMIPDTVQVGIFLLGLAWIFQTGLPLDDRLQGAAIMFGIGLLLHYGYFWLMGKHGLGFGDVKLLAGIGLWIPMAALPVFFFLSGVIGIATALIWRACGLGQHFPFGPALILSMLLLVLYPQAAQLFHVVAGL